jgi:hypothetical protein
MQRKVLGCFTQGLYSSKRFLSDLANSTGFDAHVLHMQIYCFTRLEGMYPIVHKIPNTFFAVLLSLFASGF